MDKYKRYYGVIVFVAIVLITVLGCYFVINSQAKIAKDHDSQLETLSGELAQKQEKRTNIENKLKQLSDSLAGSQKRIYSPLESDDLGSDALFFTLYSDVIEMIHSNSIKIRSIDYIYNPESDNFVVYGKDAYFVCDVNMELVSNYKALGQLIEDLYKYPYYLKINSVKVNPYELDKKILITDMSLRLYARTSPEDQTKNGIDGLSDGQ